MILMLGQVLSIASAHNYSDPPNYYRGNGLTLGTMVLGFVLTGVFIKYLADKNKGKLQAQGTEAAAAARSLGIEEIQDAHPDFMYYL